MSKSSNLWCSTGDNVFTSLLTPSLRCGPEQGGRIFTPHLQHNITAFSIIHYAVWKNEFDLCVTWKLCLWGRRGEGGGGGQPCENVCPINWCSKEKQRRIHDVLAGKSYCLTQKHTHKNMHTSILSKNLHRICSLFILNPRLHLLLCRRFFCAAHNKTTPPLQELLYKYIWLDLTCWFPQANAELCFLSPFRPPVPCHHPPAGGGGDWRQDADPASLFFWSDTESDNKGPAVAALWAHLLFTGGQEVAPACHCDVPDKEGTLKLLFSVTLWEFFYCLPEPPDIYCFPARFLILRFHLLTSSFFQRWRTWSVHRMWLI